MFVASNKPNPAQIVDKVNSADGSNACESCYGKHTSGLCLNSETVRVRFFKVKLTQPSTN